jgi:hypothetical protein
MRAFLVGAVCFTCACGLEESGLLSDAGDAAVVDAWSDVAIDVAEEPFVCADAGVASCEDAAPFRLPALYSPTAAVACPRGYGTLDLAQVVPSSNSCTCACTDAGAPSCDTTSAHWHAGATDCTLGSGTIALSGSCTSALGSISAAHVEFDTPAVTGCGGGTPIPPTFTTTNVRLCVPECTSDESVCSGGGGLQACVYVAGNTGNCPPGYPNGPVYVGATPSVQCDSCSCVATGDCSQSQFHWYSSSNCGSGDQNMKMDGTCKSANVTYMSAAVQPNLQNYQCSVSPTAPHATYGSNAFTVCCK